MGCSNSKKNTTEVAVPDGNTTAPSSSTSQEKRNLTAEQLEAVLNALDEEEQNPEDGPIIRDCLAQNLLEQVLLEDPEKPEGYLELLKIWAPKSEEHIRAVIETPVIKNAPEDLRKPDRTDGTVDRTVLCRKIRLLTLVKELLALKICPTNVVEIYQASQDAKQSAEEALTGELSDEDNELYAKLRTLCTEFDDPSQKVGASLADLTSALKSLHDLIYDTVIDWQAADLVCDAVRGILNAVKPGLGDKRAAKIEQHVNAALESYERKKQQEQKMEEERAAAGQGSA